MRIFASIVPTESLRPSSDNRVRIQINIPFPIYLHGLVFRGSSGVFDAPRKQTFLSVSARIQKGPKMQMVPP